MRGAEVTERSDKQQDELVSAVSEAVDATTRKEKVLTEALDTFRESVGTLRRTIRRQRVIIAVVLLAIGVQVWQTHEYNDRSAHNGAVLLCIGRAVNNVSGDVRTMVSTKLKAPTSAYALPAGCVLSPANK